MSLYFAFIMRRIALIRVSTLYHFSAKLRDYFKLKPNFGVEFLDTISSRTLCVSPEGWNLMTRYVVGRNDCERPDGGFVSL